MILFSCSSDETEENSAEATCTYSSESVKSETSISSEGRTIKVGYLQVTSNRQDPIVAMFNGDTQIFCRKDYDTAPTDSRALAALYSAANGLYVGFSVDGGSNDSGTISRFTQSGWQKSYGSGGGPKAGVVLKLNPETGVPSHGTYIIAKLSSGNTNTVSIESLAFSGTNVQVNSKSFFSPLKADKSRFDCSGGSSPFNYTLILGNDLSNAVSASASSPCS